jgi:hypothetical protein
MTKKNKLENLFPETLYSLVLFACKAKATRVEHLSDAIFLGKLQALSANIRQGWINLPGTNGLAF